MATEQERAVIRRIMKPIESPCVVELGARTGEDEPWIRGCCSEDPCYILVEPDMINAQKILDERRGIGVLANRRLILGAVGAHDGEVQFHVSWNPDDGSRTSGSIRRPTGHLEYYPKTVFTGVNTVPCWTLDTIYKKEWLTKIDLLWTDIQGAERDMIWGGRGALAHTRYLMMEVEAGELYEGQALRDELISMLPGWQIFADMGQNMLFSNPNMTEGRL